MRIRSVLLRNCRLHRELKVDFDPSRTLIGGPNETGKSTLIEAMHRALFLRAKGNTEYHRALISSIHPGAPEVELVFEAEGNSYALKKRFGPNGATTLAPSNSGSLAGEAAENELARLLSVEAGTTGKAVAIQWAHLWVWQGQAGHDPSTHATTQQNGLLRRLQEMGGAGALQSELDARVAAQFAQAHEQTFTQTGKPKLGSELERAGRAHALAQEELAHAKNRVQALESAATELDAATQTLDSTSTSLVALSKEQEEAEARARKLAALRQLQTEQAHAVKEALARRDRVDSANQQIRRIRAEALALEETLKPQNETIARLEQTVLGAKTQAAMTEAAHRHASEIVRIARLRRDLALARIQLFEKTDVHTRLIEKDKKAAARRRDFARLDEELAKLPNVDKTKLRGIQRLEAECSNARAALQAMATGLEVIAASEPVNANDQPLEVGQRQILTDDTEVRVGALLHLRILPGGGTGLAAARQAEDLARKNLQATLDSFGLQSVREATEAHASREDLASRIRTVQAELEGMGAKELAGELQHAQNELAASTAKVERLAALVPNELPPIDAAAALLSAKTLETQLAHDERQETQAKVMRDQAMEAVFAAEKALKSKRSQTETQSNQHTALRAQLDLLLQTHGNDTARASAWVDCQSTLSTAERVLQQTTDAIAALQPELLEADRARIARALREKSTEQNDARTRIALAQATLRSDGSDDPAAELATAEARARRAGEHLRRTQRQAEAVALLDRLFREEQRALAQQFSQPLADRISGYLQCIFGAGTRAMVDLKENEFTSLRIFRAGFGDSPFAFDSLSGGAREQTAAAVRLAMAEVLAPDHGGCLPVVFDDAFAYSDPERVNQLQRMLDLAATRGLQVIILTCNPADYAALGAKTFLLRPDRTAPAAALPQTPAAASPLAGSRRSFPGS